MKRNFFTFLLLFVFLSVVAQEEKTSVVRVLSPEGEAFVEEHMQKAADYMERERWQAAKDEYDYIIARAPFYLSAIYYRAYCNERLFHYGLARADYEAVLKAEPKHFSSLMGLAVLNQKDSHFTEAFDIANLLVEAHPDSVLSWVVRANIEEQQGHLALAEYDYSKAYELSPTTNNRKYLLHAIELMIKQKKKKEARRTLDNLVKAGVPRNSLLFYYKKL